MLVKSEVAAAARETLDFVCDVPVRLTVQKDMITKGVEKAPLNTFKKKNKNK